MQRRRSCNTKAAPLVSFALSHPFCYLSPSEHDVILRIHHCCACSFLFGWPPCQRSDMTLVEVSQHAYNCLFIRTIVLFVFLRNSCEPDMVLVYFCWINSVWVWVWVYSYRLSQHVSPRDILKTNVCWSVQIAPPKSLCKIWSETIFKSIKCGRYSEKTDNICETYLPSI